MGCLRPLQLLHVSLKREKIVSSSPEHVAMLDPFVPLLATTIKSKHVLVSRCAGYYSPQCYCCCELLCETECTALLAALLAARHGTDEVESTVLAGSLCNTAVPAVDVEVPSALVVSPPGLLHTGAILHPRAACTAWGCRWNQPGASAHCLQDNDSCNQVLPGGRRVRITAAGVWGRGRGRCGCSGHHVRMHVGDDISWMEVFSCLPLVENRIIIIANEMEE